MFTFASQVQSRQQKKVDKDDQFMHISSLTQSMSDKQLHRQQVGFYPLKQKQVSLAGQGYRNTIPTRKNIDQRYLNIPDFAKKSQRSRKYVQSRNLIEMESDTQSIGCKSIRTNQREDDYYKYWKEKAHQYLEENFKLREENKKIKALLQKNTKSESMPGKSKRFIDQTTTQQDSLQTLSRDKQAGYQSVYSRLEKIFKSKLSEFELELKQKNLRIKQLQNKVLELNQRVTCQEGREKLIAKLGNQISLLSQENINLKKSKLEEEKRQANLTPTNQRLEKLHQRRQEIAQEKQVLKPKTFINR